MARLEERQTKIPSQAAFSRRLFSNTLHRNRRKIMVVPPPEASTRHPQPSSPTSAATVKFLCSYGGKIAPRYPDGKLRYHGGETRVLAVDRSIPFSELLLKLGELCGARVILRCQLPDDDLDALVSITSDEDLANLIEEYDRAGTPKIRAFLFMPKKLTVSPSSSTSSSSSPTSPTNCYSPTVHSPASSSTPRCFRRQISRPPIVFPVKKTFPHAQFGCYVHGKPNHACLVHHGNHWQ